MSIYDPPNGWLGFHITFQFHPMFGWQNLCAVDGLKKDIPITTFLCGFHTQTTAHRIRYFQNPKRLRFSFLS